MQKEGAAPAGPCRAWQSRTGQDRAGRGRTGQGSGGGAEPGPAPLGRGQGLAVGPALPCPARLSGGSDGAAGLAAIARLLRLLRRGGGGAREGAPAQVRAGRGMRPPGTSPSCPRCALLRSPRCHRASFPARSSPGGIEPLPALFPAFPARRIPSLFPDHRDGPALLFARWDFNRGAEALNKKEGIPLHS